jgi:hypothetical protein
MEAPVFFITMVGFYNLIIYSISQDYYKSSAAALWVPENFKNDIMVK